MPVNIESFYDKDTATLTHVVYDKVTLHTAVIDPVLNYDQFSGRTSTKSVELVIKYLKENDLSLKWILETHVHADHITAAHYLKSILGGKIGASQNITKVLEYWNTVFNTNEDTSFKAEAFDCLFEDEDIIGLGESKIRVIQTPGHTPSCCSYYVNDSVFVGDTLFMPDIGTARADFPGGSASELYNSIKKILSLPDETKLYLCHDYPPETRELKVFVTVKEQNENNVLINKNISKEDYVDLRSKRDSGLPVPKLILPAIQANLRLGTFGEPEKNGVRYIKVPIDTI